MEYYYHPYLFNDHVQLSVEESKHFKVLHRKKGDEVLLSDGKGTLAKSTIMSIEKEGAVLFVTERKTEERARDFILHIAIAPTKNRDRIEWFVEKAVEIGIEKITLIICEHSERIRTDISRLERIAISAMKQSQTTWLPQIHCCSFTEFMQHSSEHGDKLIAWCGMKSMLVPQLYQLPFHTQNITILIGPEGDFSFQEVELAKKHHFQEVLLGHKRLRTETAGLYACTVITTKMEFGLPY
jgi:16S rRNA (uracil1498-N3)-methyltransferase